MQKNIEILIKKHAAMIAKQMASPLDGEVERLAEQRDYLAAVCEASLPRLLSGEMCVQNVDKTMKETL